jgi:hypothetical protein
MRWGFSFRDFRKIVSFTQTRGFVNEINDKDAFDKINMPHKNLFVWIFGEELT